MTEDLLKLIAFSIIPAVALIASSFYSTYEIRKIGQYRLGVIVLVLLLMLVHQGGEILYYLQTAEFRDPISEEIPETAANLIAAGGVYYALSFVRKEHTLRNELAVAQSEVQDAKRRLERVFDDVHDGILLIDLSREEIIEANRPAHELLRYDPGGLVGKSPSDIHTEESALVREFNDTIRADGGTVSAELQCRRNDGSVLPALVSGSRTQIDNTERMLVTIRDNSKREQYRQQLDLLARVLRHNLRNDMTVILGTLQTLKKRVDDEQLTTHAEKAINKCESLTEASEKTRKLTAVAESAETITETTDLVPLIEAIVSTHRDAASDATIQTELPESAIVRANSHIEWAIDNLVENAIVHADGEPTVVVRVERETDTDETGSEWVTVTVLDDGPGIPPHEVDVLTNESERNPTKHGSGLGLWIAQQIALAFDGTFDITRDPDGRYSTAVTLRFQPDS